MVEAKHTQGQGRASGFVQLQARDVRSGTKYVERLSPSDVVERVTLERVDYTYLYSEGKNVVLMDPTSFEQARRSSRNATPPRARPAHAPRFPARLLTAQVEVPTALLGDAAPFLADGVTVTVAKLASGEAVSATLPDTIEAEIATCSASMKARGCVALLRAAAAQREAALALPAVLHSSVNAAAASWF